MEAKQESETVLAGVSRYGTRHGAKVSCVRCAKEVSGLLLEASDVINRCATPRRAQTLARNSSREAGTRIHANANEQADNSLLFASHSISSSSLAFHSLTRPTTSTRP